MSDTRKPLARQILRFGDLFAGYLTRREIAILDG